jgi:hypothetical protein
VRFGIIDILAELLKAGIVDSYGSILTQTVWWEQCRCPCGRVITWTINARCGEQSDGVEVRDVILTQRDILQI